MNLEVRIVNQEVPILKISDMKTLFQTDYGEVTVVDGISIEAYKGETLGIVGESGCGKSMTALSIMGLLPSNGWVKEGEISLEGINLLSLSDEEYRKKRGKDMSMIFQEPMTSLNPVYSVGFQIIELLTEHKKLSKKEARAKAIEMIKLVGIPRAEEIVDEYPHQLSGGMRQRVMIAMGLACNPSVLIADEPTTALDVTIQAQILDLMKDIQNKFDMTILLITHDLGVVAEVCDRVVVMYAGQVVEQADVKQLFKEPKHPYTQGLIASTPKINEETEFLFTINGTVPDLKTMPIGCRFASRCDYVMDKCKVETPPLIEINSSRDCRCWLYNESDHCTESLELRRISND
jgi:peptide/nickel transport system ATP-binding protein